MRRKGGATVVGTEEGVYIEKRLRVQRVKVVALE